MGTPGKSGIFRREWHKKLRTCPKTLLQRTRRLGAPLYRGRDYPSKCPFIIRRLVAHPSVSAPKGNDMANRSWFYASNGQQQGPYPDAQLRELIARGAVTADTLVWSEGMAGWQRAAEIPGLFGSASSPPAIPRSGVPLASSGGHGGALSIDLGLWDFLGRSLLFSIGFLLVVPAPWVATNFYQWMAQSRLHRSSRRHLVRLRRDGAYSLCWFDGLQIPAICYHSSSVVPVLDDGAMDRFEFKFGRTAASYRL
jgi:hypothetical protein